jgi:phenylalanyl-tRNA synthetase alpha chain
MDDKHDLDAAQLAGALAVRDLTDPAQGHHALQEIVEQLERALESLWRVPVVRRRAAPVVAIADNYDRLGYSPEAITRDSRHSRYLSGEEMLRSHTSAMIPGLLRELSADPPDDLVLSCPGIVYRRDSIDRTHVGEPHQIDLWRIRRGTPRLAGADLDAMIAALVEGAVPGRRHRTVPAEHPYTLEGRQIDVADGDHWVEIGECGLAHPDVLADAGLVTEVSGLAMGLGLDRLLMLAKGLDDIRLLRAADPRIARQMHDVAPYRPVSRQPAVQRDLSVAMSHPPTAEHLGDAVREALGPGAPAVEAVEILTVVPGEEVPAAARARIGMARDQCNVLLRVVLRDLDHTLTASEANDLRDDIYAALHEGRVHQWAARPAAGEQEA